MASKFFDVKFYFNKMAAANKLAVAQNYKVVDCTGIETLEGVLAGFKSGMNFIAIDDTNDGRFFQSPSGGWFKRRTCTVFILSHYSIKDMNQRIERLDNCRELQRQFITRMVNDRYVNQSSMYTLGIEEIYYREFGALLVDGLTGTYFMINVDEPVDVSYKENEWAS